ncbi:MAG: 4Fe-4S binding protein [Ignavibacteriaceae bacterium]|nr:4Fe-4S binding protein [Ignavibacteriaceae bacterium]MCW8962119.1 4Fe-4S binding protein [Ignavibacteriaceae bacterium]MCW9095310.1 4Fe-4S binding protein [Ignavibacteriaceae bacterium]
MKNKINANWSYEGGHIEVIPSRSESELKYSEIASPARITKHQQTKRKKRIGRNKEKGIQKIRFVVQTLFALLCIWIGIEFYQFIHFLEMNGTAAFSSRPPGVDGFLPISSFMSFYLFLMTGQIHSAHPAGFFIFFAIVLMSLVFGKAFCSWLCPVGFLSELIGDFGKKIFKKDLKFPKLLDYPLRSLKYLLLGFLFFSVFFLMSVTAVQAFLDSPYNLVSDIKMFYFFADISRFSLIVFGILFLLSIVIRGFWCRYLCPYGALLGITSLLSPNKIKRNPINCIDCGLCNKACPSFVKVDKVKTVVSDECTTCMNCVDVCPIKNTLYLETLPFKKKINKKLVAIGVVAIFMLVTGFGIISGKWQNKISKTEYLELYKNMDSFGHPTGTKAIKDFNEKALSNDAGKKNRK